MIEKIAAIIAAAVVPKVIEVLKPHLEELVEWGRQELLDAGHRIKQAAIEDIRQTADRAVKDAFTALDRNKDGKIDLADIFPPR